MSADSDDEELRFIAHNLRLFLEKTMPKNLHAVIVLYNDNDDMIGVLASDEIDQEALLTIALRNIRERNPDADRSELDLGKKLH